MKRFVVFFITLLFIVSCKEKEAESTIVFTYTASSDSRNIHAWPVLDIYPVKIYWGIGEQYNMTRPINSKSLQSSMSWGNDNVGKDYTATLIGDIAGLDCSSMDIKSIDISNCYTLSILNCSINELTALDLNRNGSLSILDCSYNKLTALDLSHSASLTELHCGKNLITHLDMSANPLLVKLNCLDCPLSTEALNDLFRSLPETTKGKICIDGTAGEHDCDKSMATAKGWVFHNR